MKYLKNSLIKSFILFVITMLCCEVALAQNLLSGERITRLSSRKKSIYLDTGIFHNGGPKRKSKIKAIRHNYSKRLGYERVVMDFTTQELPRVYGYISQKERKLYLDLFRTDIPSQLDSFGKSKFVEKVNFFPIQADTLSVEVVFKKNVTLDIFFLSGPGRLVVDIKG
jgi:hypothetical protein